MTDQGNFRSRTLVAGAPTGKGLGDCSRHPIVGDPGTGLRCILQRLDDKVAEVTQFHMSRDAGPAVMDRHTMRKNVEDGVEITLAQRPDALAADLVGPAPAIQCLDIDIEMVGRRWLSQRYEKECQHRRLFSHLSPRPAVGALTERAVQLFRAPLRLTPKRESSPVTARLVSMKMSGLRPNYWLISLIEDLSFTPNTIKILPIPDNNPI